jgi:hypothetical protein
VDAYRSDDDRREGASATLLGDGRMLVAGGGNPSATLSAELYDPASGRWTTTSRMTDYHGPAAVLLQDGRVLVAGGGDAGDVYSPPLPARGLRPAQGRIPSSGTPPLPRSPNGQILSVGGKRLAPNRGERDRRCLRYGTGG